MESASKHFQTRAGLTRAALAVIACLTAFAFAAAIAPHSAFASSPEILSSEPQNNATAVPTEGTMWIEFENNVVSVPENASLVTLETEDGQVLPAENFETVLPDGQTDVEHRDYIMVNVKGLEKGKTYVIHVAPGITGKNGTVSDDETFIKFTTAAEGEKAAELTDPVAVASGERSKGNGAGDGSGDGKHENAAGSKDSSSSSASDSADTNQTQTMTTTMSPAFIVVMAAFWIAAIASAIYFVRVSKPEKTCTK